MYGTVFEFKLHATMRELKLGYVGCCISTYYTGSPAFKLYVRFYA